MREPLSPEDHAEAERDFEASADQALNECARCDRQTLRADLNASGLCLTCAADCMCANCRVTGDHDHDRRAADRRAEAAVLAAAAELWKTEIRRPMPSCSKCGRETFDLEERFSLGIYAGRYCSERCWKDSGYRDEPASAFDPADAGESMEEDE